MFVETITAPRDEWERWNERIRLLTDPPEALVASIAWDAGDGKVTGVNVWDSAEAIGEFFVARVHPTIQELGEPSTKPMRHGPPVAVYLRPRPSV
jgi:hypothetical protein